MGFDKHETGRYKLNDPDGSTLLRSELEARGIGFQITDIRATGKFIYWKLEDDWSVWNTLGMSGGWNWRGPPLDKHTALTVWTSHTLLFGCDIRPTYFTDPRHFGTVKFVKGHDKLQTKLNTMMWDMLDKPAPATPVWWFFQHQLKKYGTRPIGDVLMDQHVFPGVGNYIRAEALYVARVSPHRLIQDLKYDELERLLISTREIMVNSYNSGGATLHTFKDAEGNTGSYSSKFAVYGRKQDPLGHLVIRETMPGGRTIHYVKEVQT